MSRMRRILRFFWPFFWLAAILIGAAWVVGLPTMGGDWQAGTGRFNICRQGRSQACVIDGDTILIGYPPKARKIRMSDYNTPELKGECPAESALALRARAALLEWLNRGPFEMSGGDDPPYDKYGRELRTFKRTGSDGSDDWLVDTMLASKTARSEWGDRGGSWCY
jgi:micrococcal nuclease